MSAFFSARLHEAAAPIWAQCLNHPFVTGIGDGTLPREKFQYFMLQDYLYLFDYARVFALGVFKARDRGLMQTFAHNVENILNGEMSIHRAYMARLGITDVRIDYHCPTEEDPANTAGYYAALSVSGGVMTEAQILPMIQLEDAV